MCGDGDRDELVSAAAAVELLHMATLVHDDVLDRAELRRGRPTVFASGGRLAATATGDLLFSRAFAELDPAGCRGGGAGTVGGLFGTRARRADAARRRLGRRRDPGALLERCRLKTGSLFDASCRLGALFGGSADLAGPLGCFGAARGARLPDARRRAGRVGAARADRQAARHGPARRHRDAAADPGPPKRSGAGGARPAGARCATPARRRRSATGSPRRARSRRRAAWR